MMRIFPTFLLKLKLRLDVLVVLADGGNCRGLK